MASDIIRGATLDTGNLRTPCDRTPRGPARVLGALGLSPSGGQLAEAAPRGEGVLLASLEAHDLRAMMPGTRRMEDLG